VLLQNAFVGLQLPDSRPGRFAEALKCRFSFDSYRASWELTEVDGEPLIRLVQSIVDVAEVFV
jgi:hypothetical protein